MEKTNTRIYSRNETDWIQTFTGRAVWPLAPKVSDINAVDIFHSLSMQCRYTGHTKEFYSVAEHSYLISMACPPQFALWGLLHDASEAYLTDIPRPLKPYFEEYKGWEYNLMEVIKQKFGLEGTEPPIIKQLDTQILINERAALMSKCEREWDLKGEPIPDIVINCWSPAQAFKACKARFLELQWQSQY